MEMAEEQAKQEEQILKYGMHTHTFKTERHGVRDNQTWNTQTAQ